MIPVAKEFSGANVDSASILKSIHAELWNTQDIIRRYEDGEFDYMPEEHRAWVGSAKFYRGVLRDVEARVALLRMSPMDRLVDQVTKNHEARAEYLEDHPEFAEEVAELYPDGDPADKYLKEAYDALNRNDDQAAWKTILRMNSDLHELHQPNTLYLPNKRFWPELRVNKEAVTLRTIDRMIAGSEEI